MPNSNYDRMKRLITYMDELGHITPKEAETICDKSPAPVRGYLEVLVDTGYVETQGSTNNSVYVVSEKPRKLENINDENHQSSSSNHSIHHPIR